jgi:hypothetical protein
MTPTRRWTQLFLGRRGGSAIEVSTECVLPSELNHTSQNDGAFSLVVLADGIGSVAVSFYGPLWADFNYSGPTQSGSYHTRSKPWLKRLTR